MRTLAALFALLLAACSPYASQIKRLDQAYAAGRISERDYHRQRNQALIAQQEWRSNHAAAVAAVNASVQQQQAINAYNQRTWALRQPQNVNVHHSGEVRHNVYNY